MSGRIEGVPAAHNAKLIQLGIGFGGPHERFECLERHPDFCHFFMDMLEWFHTRVSMSSDAGPSRNYVWQSCA